MIASLFPHAGFAWALWGIHVASAVLTALLIPGGQAIGRKTNPPRGHSLPDALNHAIRVMAAVCGWVILFRVMITFLKRWILWAFPPGIQTALIGLLELSNGCYELPAVSDLALRFLICSGILAFGGLCVTMQTVSVTEGLSLRYYFLGKVLQTAFSLAICMGILQRSWLLFFIVLLLSGFLLRKKQKKSSICQTIRV